MADSIALSDMSGEKPTTNGGGDSQTYTVGIKSPGVDDSGFEKLIDVEADEQKREKEAQRKKMAERLKSNDFTGLTKEELAEYAKDPRWRKIRIVMFTLFWVIWVALLAAAVIIIAVSPRCAPRPDVPFYQKDFIYKVLPLSYAVRSNGDGWGHLVGLASKLSYIKSLGASTVLIGPTFGASSGALALYDTLNNTELDSRVGHFVPCLQAMTKEAAKQGLKVIAEVQVNFASVKHPLFQQQIVQSDPTVGAFLIFNKNNVNSNLLARDGKSAWRTVPNNAAYVYYSSFTDDVAEWNFINSTAVENARSLVQQLVLSDVDGVLIKDASFLVECDGLASADESVVSPNESYYGHAFWKRTHPCTLNQNGSVALIEQLAKVITNRNDEEDRRKRVLLVELAAPSGTAVFSDFVKDGAANGAFIDTFDDVNFGSLSLNCKVDCLRSRIEAYASNFTQQGNSLRLPLWQLSTPEYGRFRTRFGASSAAALWTLGAFLPGGFSVYYGDEVSLDAGVIPKLSNLFFDSKFRTTMQWTSASPYAGFLSAAKVNTTLPAELLAPNASESYLTSNVQVQQAVGYSNSQITLLSSIAAARRGAESAQWGSFYPITNALVQGTPSLRGSLIAFVRAAVGFDPVVVLVNGFGDVDATQVGNVALDTAVCDALRASAEWGTLFSASSKTYKCSNATVLFSSGSTLQKDDKLIISNLFVNNNQVLVLRITPAV